MTTTDIPTKSYVVRHPDIKNGRPIVFESKAQAETMVPNILAFNRWLFAGGVPRKEQSK